MLASFAFAVYLYLITQFRRHFFQKNAVRQRLFCRLPPGTAVTIVAASAFDVSKATIIWPASGLTLRGEPHHGRRVGEHSAFFMPNTLRIPRKAFVARDLSKPLKLGRRFDLCLCLEVAEHLPEECAKDFVTSLTSLASIVAFSAAVPGQGGINHINEHWQSYWIGLLQRHGFRASDCIRPRIWGNPKVAWWYAQNMLLFLGPKFNIRVEAIRAALVKDRSGIVDVVHPRGLLRQAAQFRSATAHPL